jgi:hypothetical protein
VNELRVQFRHLEGTNLAHAEDHRAVLTTSDNNGDLFPFSRLGADVWVVADELVAGGDWQHQVRRSETVNAALVARKVTDILLLKLNSVPDYLDLSPTSDRGLYVRAAYLSWANLVRTAACDALDVETDEIAVSFVALPGRSNPEAAIFLSDQLVNGAGYCTYVAGPTRLAKTLVEPLVLRGSRLHDRLTIGEHESCDGACYECLMDYANSAVHAVLDWRLGIDLARLSSDGESAIDLKQSYWRDVALRAAKSLARSIGNSEVKRVGSLLSVVERNTVRALITHPLWTARHPAIVEAAQLCDRTPEDLRTCTVFDALRRPGWFISRSWENVTQTTSS